MLNIGLFLISCALIAGFAWIFLAQGKSALIAWIAILGLLANLFVLKQIELFGFNATASDIFGIGSLLALNLLQEKYGRKTAQKSIWIGFCCLLFFIFMSQIHLLYEPSQYDHAHHAFLTLLAPAPRIIVASLATFLITQQLDSRLYALFRRQFPRLPFLCASAISMSLSQLLDTVLFSVLGLYGIVDALLEIIIVSYMIKLLAIINTIPFAFLTRRILTKTYAQ